MAPQEVTLHVVMFKSGKQWIGQCLEYDIAAQAKTLEDLPYELERAIVGHIVIAESNGFEPFKALPKAPDRFWTMFDKGSKVDSPEEHVFKIDGRSHRAPRQELRLLRPVEQPA